MVKVELAVLLFPASSVNVAPGTEREPVPACVFVVGVKTTEYTAEDVVVSDPMVPPETVISPTAKVLDASDNVKVIVSVCPDFNVPDPARLNVTVGATPSTCCVDCVATDVCVMVALFAAVSVIVPELRLNVSAEMESPSVSLSPEATV